MKKLIYCAAALAAMIFAGSCQQENLEPVAQENTVTYTVKVPEVQTKAIGEASTVNQLIYEVYKTEADDVTELTDPKKAVRLYQAETAVQNGEAIVTLNLVQDQEYTILFWAQVRGTNAYDTEYLTNVHYANAYSATDKFYQSNVENYAAFYAVEFVSDSDDKSRTVTLTRPFAQLNIGTLNTVNPDEYTVTMEKSEVTVTNVPTGFNVATKEALGEGTVVFNYNAVPSEPATLKVNKEEYEYVAMNYIFADATKRTTTVTYNIKSTLTSQDNEVVSAEKVIVNNEIEYVPYTENYRTNIVGNLLTSTTKYDVIIDADFQAPEIVLGDEWIQTGAYSYTINPGASPATLAQVLAHADAEAKRVETKANGPAITIDLAGDVEWVTGSGHGSTPLLPADSPISAVVINGNGKTFTATGAGVGEIRLANGGLLTFNKVNVIDKSVSYAEGNWEFTYLEFAGKLSFNECVFNSGVQFQSPETVVSCVNCDFISKEADVYAAWICGGIVSFEGCSFTGTRGLKAHEQYGAEVKSVVVDGCTFNQIEKKPGIVLGTLNAETSVTIQNSTFDRCQAGEQGKFIYESDTDVATFTFVCKNNFVIPVGDTPYVNEDGRIVVASATALKTALNAATSGSTIILANGVYDDIFTVGAKNITLKALNPGKAEIAGRVIVAGNSNSTLSCKDLKFSVSENTGIETGIGNYDKGVNYIIGIYCGNVTIDNCEFTGMTDDQGAISYHSYVAGTTTEAVEVLTVTNSKFNGGRAIRARANVTVTGCQFTGLLNPCLQVLGLGDDNLHSNVVFTSNSSDVVTSGVCIKTSNFDTKNITFNVGGNTNCNYIAFDSKNLNNLHPETYTYTGEVNTLTPETAAGLSLLLNDATVNSITLLPVEYNMTAVEYIKHPIVLKTGNSTLKPTVKGKLVADYADFTAENIKFEFNDITSTKLVTKTYGTYVNNGDPIVVVNHSKGSFKGCEFNGGDNYHVGVMYFQGTAGKVLTVNGCIFNNSYIYSEVLCNVTENTFNLGGCPYAMCVWPREAGSTNSECSFVNNVVNSTFSNGKANNYVHLLSHSGPYANVVFNVQGNIGASAKIYDAAKAVSTNSNIVATDGTVTFAPGSKKFKINEDGTFGGDINE